ncbi:MAG: exodeoxyribonuclease VII large subunit, partial [Clostridiales Family XIII bacterium]|nr:exodeoxyribonuclease VII large subunit [Clostridiales Family XIII bacterium]
MKAIKVSQINAYIKKLFDKDYILSDIVLKGELSGFIPRETGHIYFNMIDESSRINCIIWDGNYDYEIIKNLKDGIEVEAEGRITLYEKGGNYSFHINKLIVNREGEILKKIEDLKEKLNKEGLFDNKYKKKLPVFPKNIALITANNSAALADMMKIIEQRNNIVNIYIFPSNVQGEYAATSLKKAIGKVNKDYAFIDLIIIGRGGGSIEDLMAFNNEDLAREIFVSKIPIISAVGHEIDFSISDFVADIRAETPTRAAIIAVPDIFSIRQELDELLFSVKNKLKTKLEYYAVLLDNFSNENLLQRIYSKLEYNKTLLNNFSNENLNKNIQHKIETCKSRLNNFSEINLQKSIQHKVDKYYGEIEIILAGLEAKNPKRILRRGYAYLENEDGKNLKRVADFKDNKKVIAKLYDGRIE